ncbi:MAG: phosphatase PAP2 family protein [Patescibacteria group bacterium]
MQWLILFGAKYLILIFLALPFVLWLEKERKLAYRVLASMVLAEILVLILGRMFPYPRPFEVYGVDRDSFFFIFPTTSSFPSGHTAVSFAAAFTCFFDQKVWGKLLLIFAFIIGLSRFFALIHFSHDIIAGAALGLVSAFAIEKLKEGVTWL